MEFLPENPPEAPYFVIFVPVCAVRTVAEVVRRSVHFRISGGIRKRIVFKPNSRRNSCGGGELL